MMADDRERMIATYQRDADNYKNKLAECTNANQRIYWQNCQEIAERVVAQLRGED